MTGPRLVAGLDGSSADRTTLAYALAAAARRGAELTVVTVLPTGLAWTAATYALDVPTERAEREEIEARIARLVDEVRDATPPPGGAAADAVPVHVRVPSGRPAQVLVEASAGADLLVVGRRRRSPVRRTLLGSVALRCISHAACPVVVVPPARPAGPGSPTVVVGVDGSSCAGEALGLAAEEAARLGATVEAVAAYATVDYPLDLYRSELPTPEQLRAEAERVARQQADAVLDRLARAGRAAAGVPPVEVVPVEGEPADVLVERSRDSALLVVGSHGHGRVREVVLGSVALHCALYTDCPVMIVRSTAAARRSVPAGTAEPAPPSGGQP